MFYQKDDLDPLVYCPKCEDRYVEPKIIVPCTKTLCARCIEESISDDGQFECFFCRVKHLVPQGGFNADATIERLLRLQPNDVHRNTKLVDELQGKLTKMQSLFDAFTKQQQGIESELYEHCASVKGQIDLISDCKIEQINGIREMYLKSVDNYRESCLRNFNQIQPQMETKKAEFKQYMDECRKFLKNFKLDDEQIKAQTLKTAAKLDELELEINQLEFVTFGGHKIYFQSDESEIADEFVGKLVETELQEFDCKEEIDCKIASASGDKTLKIWKYKNNQCIGTLTEHNNHVNSIAFLDDKTIVSGSSDKTLKIWNLDNGSCITTLLGHTDIVYCVSVIDRNTIASASWDKTVKIWNLSSAECVKTLEGHLQRVFCLCVIDTNTLVSGSSDNTLKVWNLTEAKCKQTLSEHTDIARCVSSVDKSRIVSGSYDKTLKIWNIDTGKCLTTLNGHSEKVYCVVCVDDLIISGSNDKTIKLWKVDQSDPTATCCIKTLTGNTDTIRCLSLIGKNKLVSGSNDKIIKIWNLQNGKCIRTIKGHNRKINDLSTFI